METQIDTVMDRIEPYLDLYDKIMRHGHATYKSYLPNIVIDHDASTQAHCTNRHILAKAHMELDAMPMVRHFEVRQQNLWLFEAANAVVRFKKTDENGVSSNFQTRQAAAFDQGDELPGLMAAPIRLTIGYLLDESGTEFVRSQVSLPTKKGAIWCAAIVPTSLREEDEASWYEVTKQYNANV